MDGRIHSNCFRCRSAVAGSGKHTEGCPVELKLEPDVVERILLDDDFLAECAQVDSPT